MVGSNPLETRHSDEPMTDYFYQAARLDRRDRAADDGPEIDPAAPRNPYPPEDEAYWAEAGAASAEDEPLWYEDRVARAEAARDPGSRYPDPATGWAEPAARWAEPASHSDDPPAGAREPAAYQDTGPYPMPGDEPWQDQGRFAAPAEVDIEDGERGNDDPDVSEPGAEARTYAPGGAAAAAAAAAAAGRRIRFDPTKERGADYYDRAARHSRRVRLLKVALPAIAVLAVVGFVAVMRLNSGGAAPVFTLSGINVAERSITMDKPRISGFEGTRRAYEVRATKAVQDLGNPKRVTLSNVKARFGIGDGTRANLEAATGIYDGNTKILILKGNVTLVTDNGYEAELAEAEVEVEKGIVRSTSPLVIRGKEGSISANAIEVLDNGRHVFFRNGVKVLYTPPDDKVEGEDGGGGAAPAADAPAAATSGGAT
jgi:lipopolysaccharide export system protein LptC